MSKLIEFTDRAVSGPPCSYANLIAYQTNNVPGVQYMTILPGAVVPQNTHVAADSNGNPLYTSAGRVLIVDMAGNPIPMPVEPLNTCGNYNLLKNAYV